MITLLKTAALQQRKDLRQPEYLRVLKGKEKI
jgi:hypothetical protein